MNLKRKKKSRARFGFHPPPAGLVCLRLNLLPSLCCGQHAGCWKLIYWQRFRFFHYAANNVCQVGFAAENNPQRLTYPWRAAGRGMPFLALLPFLKKIPGSQSRYKLKFYKVTRLSQHKCVWIIFTPCDIVTFLLNNFLITEIVSRFYRIIYTEVTVILFHVIKITQNYHITCRTLMQSRPWHARHTRFCFFFPRMAAMHFSTTNFCSQSTVMIRVVHY